jgi:hypothetical protein
MVSLESGLIGTMSLEFGRVRLPDGRDSEPRPLDKEDIDEAIELKSSHWIIGIPVFVGFWLTLFLFIIPVVQGDF